MNKTLKKAFEDMRRFSIGTPKESYTFSEVQSFLEDQKRGIQSYLEKPIATEYERLASENSSLTQKHEEVSKQLETISNENKELSTKAETLEKSLEPFKKQATNEKAIKLLSGKVVKGAELDAYNLLNHDELKDIAEDKLGSVVETQLNALFESKGYLKPIVEKAEKAEKILSLNEGGEKIEENTFVPTRETVRRRDY